MVGESSEGTGSKSMMSDSWNWLLEQGRALRPYPLVYWGLVGAGIGGILVMSSCSYMMRQRPERYRPSGRSSRAVSQTDGIPQGLEAAVEQAQEGGSPVFQYKTRIVVEGKTKDDPMTVYFWDGDVFWNYEVQNRTAFEDIERVIAAVKQQSKSMYPREPFDDKRDIPLIYRDADIDGDGKISAANLAAFKQQAHIVCR